MSSTTIIRWTRLRLMLIVFDLETQRRRAVPEPRVIHSTTFSDPSSACSVASISILFRLLIGFHVELRSCENSKGFRGVVRIRRRKAPYLAPPQHNVPRSSSNSSKPLGTPISTSRASPSQAPGTAYRNQSIFPSSSRVITLSTVQPSDRPAARPSIERRAVISPRPSSEKADGSALEKATVAASDGCSCTVEDADPSSRV